MNINDKLASLKYNKDEKSHLEVNNDLCLRCKDKICTYICPASVYEWDEKKATLKIRHENCLECGACKIACDKKNINWRYPSVEYGVIYKNG